MPLDYILRDLHDRHDLLGNQRLFTSSKLQGHAERLNCDRTTVQRLERLIADDGTCARSEWNAH